MKRYFVSQTEVSYHPCCYDFLIFITEVSSLRQYVDVMHCCDSG